MLTFNIASEILVLYLLLINLIYFKKKNQFLFSAVWKIFHIKKCIQILKISWIGSGYVKQTVLRCVLELSVYVQNMATIKNAV